MKHMKTLSILLLSILLLCGCQANQQNPSSSTPEGEVIITGIVKNRDFYPHVNELVLKLPFFEEGQTSYTTPIAGLDVQMFHVRLDAYFANFSLKSEIEMETIV